MSIKFIIVGPFDDFDEENLYWNNDTGWGSRASATVFDDISLIDPIEAQGREFVGSLYPEHSQA